MTNSSKGLHFALKVLMFRQVSMQSRFKYFFFILLNRVEFVLIKFGLIRKVNILNLPENLNHQVMEIKTNKNNLKFEIVNYESFFYTHGVLNKFALGISESLKKRNLEFTLEKFPTGKSANVFHIFYRFALPLKNTNNIALVTHIDSHSKIKQLQWLAKRGFSFVCFSRQTANVLESLVGEFMKDSTKRIDYFEIPPFHAGPRRKLNVGFFSNVYKDGRKREKIILDSLRELNPNDFKISLMGSGLLELVTTLKKLKFEVSYMSVFDDQFYTSALSNLDLLVYSGLDEGAISVLDAAKAGIPLAITPVGFHLDFAGMDSVSFFSSQSELTDILNSHASRFSKLREILDLRSFDNYAISLVNFIAVLE